MVNEEFVAFLRARLAEARSEISSPEQLRALDVWRATIDDYAQRQRSGFKDTEARDHHYALVLHDLHWWAARFRNHPDYREEWAP